MTESPESERSDAPGNSVPVVGIGASAGGLAALRKFLSALPLGTGFAFIVVQHLDPTQKAMLAALLQRVTPLQVTEARDGIRVEADHVYVIPPNTVLTVGRGRLHLAPPDQPRGHRLPIDSLFESIGRECGARGVGVVLSGMGSDGTAGLAAIRAAGGLTMAQEPDSAEFDGMPRSAMQAGHIDIVALPGELPARLLAWPGLPPEPDDAETPPAQSFPEVMAGDLQRILACLRDRGRHDFTLYKASTLQRRVERRMSIHRLASMSAYADLLEKNEQELDLLFKELLIGVTSFFRDTAVWQALKSEVLPAIFTARGTAHRLRAWVVGCSTGEEAYSLAMVYREVQASMPGYEGGSLQIFATDLSTDAIDSARRGFFGPDIATEVSAQRLANFFTAKRGGYRIKHALREMVVFAPHDVLNDPPFSRLDLLSCRNLLIYLTLPLQERLLPLFHYTLRPGGVMLLGSSETQGRFEQLFAPLDPKLRLYRRVDASSHPAVPQFPLRPALPVKINRLEARVTEELNPELNPPSGIQTAADDALLRYVAPPAVLVSAAGDIVYIHGRTGKYLEPAAGRANWNIHVMAREGLRAAIGLAITKVLEGAGVVELPGLALDASPGAALVDVTVRALTEPGQLNGMVMISFRDVGAASRTRRRPRGAANRELEAELQRTREESQGLREEMRAQQEETKAAHEELHSTNEELQSTNEELTSSREELQSMNEELQAVNAELRSKVEDLELVQSDMRNLLNSTDIATLFLDRDLNVRRFTDRARNIISLRDSDIGRPLSELATQLEYSGLEADVREMLRTLVVKETEIHSVEGRWYSVRVLPYRTQDNVIAGAVITFVDITMAKDLEARLRSA